MSETNYRIKYRNGDFEVSARARESNLSYVNRLLVVLENRCFVHQTKEGFKLTKLGIKNVEDEILTKKHEISS
jgi:hypothetical protein